MSHSDRLNIAVFIDFDNIEIGVKNTLGQQFDVGVILDAIKERGEIVTKIAYADWTRAGEYSRHMTQHAIRLVQRNLTPGGDKNGADINLALDALEMAFTHTHINAYVIVGGDSDFLSLVEKLKQYDKKVFVVGGRAFTSLILQRNCHEFIAYENLAGVRKAAVKAGRPAAATASAPLAQAYPVVRRALKILSDREVSPQTGLLKSTLLQLDSTFSERNYGASSFLDFVEKLSQGGLVQLKHSGRSVMVELNAGFEEGPTTDSGTAGPKTFAALESEAAEGRPSQDTPTGSTSSPNGASTGASTGASATTFAAGPAPTQEPVTVIGDTTEGARIAGEILRQATSARWPMYLRNVKQIFRAAPEPFDERRYGFGSLMDLLRALQRDGVIRLERDRRGGLRVFPGASIPARPSAPVPSGNEQPPMMVDAGDPQPGNVLDVEEDDEDSGPQPGNQAIPIDTTAELLGRAQHRRPRTRAAVTSLTTAAPRATRKTATPRKTATRRPARAKKRSDSD